MALPSANILVLLLAFRIANSLFIYTKFDPDEYWQSLEVVHAYYYGWGTGYGLLVLRDNLS